MPVVLEGHEANNAPCCEFFNWKVRAQVTDVPEESHETHQCRHEQSHQTLQGPAGVQQFLTVDQSYELQKAVDAIFAKDGEMLRGLAYSFTISDPNIKDCPLIGCSSGFMELCGYSYNEIIGRNCRFLVEPVAPELVEEKERRRAREFCEAVRLNTVYVCPDHLREPWMPAVHSDDGVFCIQTNARKDGTLFKNLFYMKRVDLDDRPYIIGLQTAVPSEHWEGGTPEPLCREACRKAFANMAATERALSKLFWYQSPMRRQEDEDADDGYAARQSEQMPRLVS